MSITKIVFALLLTISLLYVARKSSMRNIPPTTVEATYEDLKFSHSGDHIFKGDTTPAVFEVKVAGGLLPDGSELALYYEPRGASQGALPANPQRIAGAAIPGEGLVYRFEIPNQGRGNEFEYYIQLEDASSLVLASLPPNLPDQAADPLWFRFEGRRSVPLLVTHITGMFASFLLMLLAFMAAVERLRSDQSRIRLGRLVLSATLALFLGGFALGFWINHQVYGAMWTGFPLGRDITDTKTLVIFFYWLFLLFLLRGSALYHNPRGDSVGAGSARWLTILGALLSIAAFLYPHSSGNY